MEGPSKYMNRCGKKISKLKQNQFFEPIFKETVNKSEKQCATWNILEFSTNSSQSKFQF